MGPKDFIKCAHGRTHTGINELNFLERTEKHFPNHLFQQQSVLEGMIQLQKKGSLEVRQPKSTQLGETGFHDSWLKSY